MPADNKGSVKCYKCEWNRGVSVKIIVAITFVLTAWYGCKKDDPMDEAREALRDDPA